MQPLKYLETHTEPTRIASLPETKEEKLDKLLADLKYHEDLEMLRNLVTLGVITAAWFFR